MKRIELKFFNIYFVNLIKRCLFQPFENHLKMNSLDLKSKNTRRFGGYVLILLICLISSSLYAQKSVRIGYIDTEYVLENINEYSIANTQLDAKINEWKAEIEQRLTELEDEKKKLTNERILLTNELISEREEDLQIIENEIIDYQQKRFGPGGDLMIQKQQLIQPIQDQIFAAVQEIASSKKYDFIFDKSADVVMLYSADRYDISERVLKTINRTSKRTQAETKKDRKEAKEEETIVEVDSGKSDRQKILDKRKLEREALLEKKRQEQLEAKEARKKALETKKQKKLEDRAKEKEEKTKASSGITVEENNKESLLEKKLSAKEQRKKEITERKAERKALLEKKKQKELEAKKVRKKELEAKEREPLEKSDNKKENKSLSDTTLDEDEKETLTEKKLTAKELRKEKLDERKKALEEKKKRLLEERKARAKEQKRKRDSIKNNK